MPVRGGGLALAMAAVVAGAVGPGVLLKSAGRQLPLLQGIGRRGGVCKAGGIRCQVRRDDPGLEPAANGAVVEAKGHGRSASMSRVNASVDASWPVRGKRSLHSKGAVPLAAMPTAL